MLVIFHVKSKPHHSYKSSISKKEYLIPLIIRVFIGLHKSACTSSSEVLILHDDSENNKLCYLHTHLSQNYGLDQFAVSQSPYSCALTMQDF